MALHNIAELVYIVLLLSVMIISRKSENSFIHKYDWCIFGSSSLVLAVIEGLSISLIGSIYSAYLVGMVVASCLFLAAAEFSFGRKKRLSEKIISVNKNIKSDEPIVASEATITD